MRLFKFTLFLAIFATSSCFSLDHFERLQLLKNKGFAPKVIYDIGAFSGEWSQLTKRVFPHSQFFLFEANENLKPRLQSAGFPFFIALLGNEEKMVPFHMKGNTGDSIFLEQTHYFSGNNYETRELQMTKLSSLVKQNYLPLPDLIKMDVQGAEKLIIEGSPEIITNAEVVILETMVLEYNKGAPFANEIMALMYNLGYVLLDIVELHYLSTGELIEVDFLFVKRDSALIKKGILV